ncbi:MAG: pilus assembly protein TadG-related protein [Bryobacteraceae bacterium]
MKRCGSERGQVLMMVTVSLFAMIGLMSLAVDLGWAHFVKRGAQKAADAAALAGVYRVFRAAGEEFNIKCGGEVICQGTAPCPATPPATPSNNIEAACLYAKINGFTMSGDYGRQKVSAAGGAGAPPTAPGIQALYWNTITVEQEVPQFWSAVMGQGAMHVTARSTAAIVDADMTASVVLLNREKDCIPMESTANLTCGVDLLVSANNNQGADALRADGGIYMASNKDGTEADGRFAGENSGGGTIRSPFTRIRGKGWYTISNNAQWIETPVNRDSRGALDPMRGKGQPPPPTGLPDRQILGGAIVGSNDPNNPLILRPGNYYATARDNQGNPYATGEPITVSGYVRFSDNGTGFGDYVFFGGFKNQSAGTTVYFDPGRYIFAGVKRKNNGTANPLFSVSTNMSIKDVNYDSATSAGELFVFTDTNYTAQGRSLEIPSLVKPVAAQLVHGNAGFQSGSNANVVTQLHGLNANSPNLPAELKKFAHVLAWQDQKNSIVKYDDTGHYVNCGSYICPNTNLATPTSTELFLQGSPTAKMYGIIYQPRGSWTTVQGGGTYKVPVQLIAGSLKIQGSAAFAMEKLPIPVTVRTVALVE